MLDPTDTWPGAQARRDPGWFPAAVALALLLHGAALAGARGLRHPAPATPARAEAIIQVEPLAEAPPPRAPETLAAPAPVPAAAPAPLRAAPGAPKPSEDPYDAPPSPARAAKALVREDDRVEERSANTVATGDGAATHGQQSGQGKGEVPTADPRAGLDGQPGGTGSGPATPKGAVAPPAPDRSRAPGLVGGSSWRCPFPPEADAEQIDEAVVTIGVTVAPAGVPVSVRVIGDPGHGFGRAARSCALARQYAPGLDRTGAAVTAVTPPIAVHFSR
jgi:protein TonB